MRSNRVNTRPQTIHSLRPNSGIRRRDFLRGLGGSLLLPWLEAVHAPVFAQQSTHPRCFLGFYTPNGFNMQRFWPTQGGILTPAKLAGQSTAPLSPHLPEITMIRGLDNFAGTPQGDGPGDHARGTCTSFTCAHPLKSVAEIRCGMSLDQRLAAHWLGGTPIRSLEVGCEGGGNVGNCDSGYSCAYSRNISWIDDRTPLPKEINPRLLFNRLFGQLDPNQSPAAIELRRQRRQSVLDFVTEDARRLSSELSASDRHRVDAYLSGIRSIEVRLNETMNAQCSHGEALPLGIPVERAEHADLLLQLIVSAFRCGQTQVATFMLGNGASNYSYTALDIAEGHHALSHHQQDSRKLDQLARIDEWQVNVLASVIEQLKEVEEGNQRLIDRCTVVATSEVEDGNSHRHAALPLMIAGHVGGIERGHYYDLRNTNDYGRPIADLFLRILRDAGVNDEQFGDDGERALELNS